MFLKQEEKALWIQCLIHYCNCHSFKDSHKKTLPISWGKSSWALQSIKPAKLSWKPVTHAVNWYSYWKVKSPHVLHLRIHHTAPRNIFRHLMSSSHNLCSGWAPPTSRPIPPKPRPTQWASARLSSWANCSIWHIPPELHEYHQQPRPSLNSRLWAESTDNLEKRIGNFILTHIDVRQAGKYWK